MLGKCTDRSASELKDPLLSVLLRDAFAEDPALAESPGRTEHIMRKVLASGVRPVWRFNWASLAWVSGSVATAAAMVALAFMLVNQPGKDKNDYAKNDPARSIVDVNPNRDDEISPRKIIPVPPVVVEQPPTNWENTASPSVPDRKPSDNTRDNTMTDSPTNTDESQTQVAAALIDAGTAANFVGDYEGAYHSYQASYEISPTPNSLVASGKALELLAEQVLEQDDSST